MPTGYHRGRYLSIIYATVNNTEFFAIDDLSLNGQTATPTLGAFGTFVLVLVLGGIGVGAIARRQSTLA